MATEESKILTKFLLCDLKLEFERRSTSIILRMDRAMDIVQRLDKLIKKNFIVLKLRNRKADALLTRVGKLPALLRIEDHNKLARNGPFDEIEDCMVIKTNDDYQDCWEESCFNERRPSNKRIDESFVKELKKWKMDFEHIINECCRGETKDSLNLPMDEGEKIKIDNKDTQEIIPMDDDGSKSCNQNI